PLPDLDVAVRDGAEGEVAGRRRDRDGVRRTGTGWPVVRDLDLVDGCEAVLLRVAVDPRVVLELAVREDVEALDGRVVCLVDDLAAPAEGRAVAARAEGEGDLAGPVIQELAVAGRAPGRRGG